MSQRILVVGATGRIGAALWPLLLARRVAVRALVRDAARAQRLAAAGVEIVAGALESETAVRTAVAGAEAVFLVTIDHRDQVARERRVIDAAEDAGVARIVKISAYAAGLDPPPGYGRLHAEIEARLRRARCDWTILRPYVFMQNLLEFAPIIARRGLLPAPFGRARVSLVDTRDVADVACAALLDPGHAGRVYEVTGPEALSFADAAALIGAATGRAVRYVAVPGFIAGLAMRAGGVSWWDVRERLALFAMVRRGEEAAVRTTQADVAHTAPRTLAAFVQEHRGRFLPD
jgi:uncharacterized protein YbjT (DUF2867 family)